MDHKRLAELLFPDVTMTPEELEEKYPPRDLPEGAKVTRFAPSPTGFVHIGGVYQTMVGERLAHQSGGVFYLRIEDTDAKREVPGAAEGLINTLARYGIRFDEGAAIGENGEIIDRGNYGPYKQSLRGDIYHVYAKKLVAEGKAYPCFTTDEELRALEAVDKKAEVKSREWTEETEAEQKAAMRRLREFTIEDVERNLAAGNKFVLRILADGDPGSVGGVAAAAHPLPVVKAEETTEAERPFRRERRPRLAAVAVRPEVATGGSCCMLSHGQPPRSPPMRLFAGWAPRTEVSG